jgi:TfoX N-terminal domain
MGWEQDRRAMTSAYPGPAEKLALYERVVEATPGVERKGATMPYTSRNGHMFSFLDAYGVLSLRLPPDAREEFLSRYGTTLAVQHGRTMQEYVVVPDDLLDRTDELQPWLERAHGWISKLKPKATTRARKA